MTVDEIRELVGRLSYKPGWKFKVWEVTTPSRTVMLSAQFLVPNSNAPEVLLPVGITQHFDAYMMGLMDERAVIELLRELVRRGEMHEIDEWFMVDGIRVKDPHPELNKYSEQKLAQLIPSGSLSV